MSCFFSSFFKKVNQIKSSIGLSLRRLTVGFYSPYYSVAKGWCLECASELSLLLIWWAQNAPHVPTWMEWFSYVPPLEMALCCSVAWGAMVHSVRNHATPKARSSWIPKDVLLCAGLLSLWYFTEVPQRVLTLQTSLERGPWGSEKQKETLDNVHRAV